MTTKRCAGRRAAKSAATQLAVEEQSDTLYKKATVKATTGSAKGMTMSRTPYQGDYKFHPEDEFRTAEEILQDCREIEARIHKLEQEKRQ